MIPYLDDDERKVVYAWFHDIVNPPAFGKRKIDAEEGKLIVVNPSATFAKDRDLMRYDFLKFIDFTDHIDLDVDDAICGVEYERRHAKTAEKKEIFREREDKFLKFADRVIDADEEYDDRCGEFRFFYDLREKNIKRLKGEEKKSGTMESMSVF